MEWSWARLENLWMEHGCTSNHFLILNIRFLDITASDYLIFQIL